MAQNIVTTISFSDDDPPAVTITVYGNGQSLVEGSTLSPQDATKLIRTIGTVSNDPDVEPALGAMVAPVLERLRVAVQEGDAKQSRRKDALTAWEAAAQNTPTPPTPPTPGKP